MTLKDDIQSDLVDEKVGLSTVLRKASILAHRLQSEDYKAWVNSELNGYEGETENLPQYRHVGTHTYGHFSGPFQSGIQNAPIPTAHLPEEIRDYANNFWFFQSVKELESMVESGERHFRMPWPPDLTVLIADKVYKNMVCMQAWKTISVDQVEGILETVRNRLLNFMLELEDIDPSFSEPDASARSIQPDAVSQVFNNFIMGSHNVVGSGYAVTQTTTQGITSGDFESLAALLGQSGIAEPDTENLHAALEEDGARSKNDGIGPAVKKWIAGMVSKIASGAWDIAIETGPMLLTSALSSYYGWN